MIFLYCYQDRKTEDIGIYQQGVKLGRGRFTSSNLFTCLDALKMVYFIHPECAYAEVYGSQVCLFVCVCVSVCLLHLPWSQELFEC